MSVQRGRRDTAAKPVRKRRRPLLILVDRQAQIVHAEDEALRLLEALCEAPPQRRLPQVIERAVLSAITHRAGVEPQSFCPVPSLVVHVSEIAGGKSPLYALMLERESRRAPLDSAGGRFSITAREREVLLLMMRGMHAADIAERLAISQSTVSGYFKQLLRKTRARSRSEMIAKILDWDDPAELR